MGQRARDLMSAGTHERPVTGERTGPVRDRTGRRTALIRIGALPALVAVAFAVIVLTGDVSTDRVRGLVDGSGGAGPLIFFFTSALLTVCFFPGPMLAISAGLLFGTAGGYPLAMVSALAGACTAFLLSRTIAHGAVEEIQGPRLMRLRAWVGERGFLSVFTARLLPGIPYNSVNYAAGLTPIPLAPFTAATVLGAAPRTYAYVSVGGAWGNWTSPAFIGACLLLVVLTLAGVWLAKRRGAPRRTTASRPVS